MPAPRQRTNWRSTDAGPLMPKQPDARRLPRSRTRLRPGKLLTRDGRFLADCAILDRSQTGARLRLFGPKELPPTFFLYDEADAEKQEAQAVWIRGSEGGIRFRAPPERIDAAERERIAGRYYAVVD